MRNNSTRNSNTSLILNNKNKKDELLKAFKTQFKIKPITETDLCSNFPANHMYINDQL